MNIGEFRVEWRIGLPVNYRFFGFLDLLAVVPVLFRE